MIRAALKRIGIYYYILPTAVQARRVMFEGKTDGGQRIIDFIPPELIKKVNIQQMSVTLHNDSQIIFVGSDNYDSLRGTNPVGCVFSEYAYQDPQAYPTVRPILLNNGGFAIFVSTPFGENHFYTLFEIAKANPESWYTCFMTVSDTGHISEEQIRKEVETGEISSDMAEQEYFCSFSIGAIGAYYAKYLNRMELNSQVGTLDWEPNFKVHTAWDLGMSDETCILMFQIIGNKIHVIDMYQNNSVGLEHYINVLQAKPYTWGKHIAPHDIEVREWTSGGISRKDKAAQLGFRFLVAPRLEIIDGIESVRTTLPRVYVDTRTCQILLKTLRNYRREYDPVKKVYKDRPYHNEWSHCADALRYLCTALPKLKDGSDPETLDRRYKEAMFGAEAGQPPFFNDNYEGY